MTGWRHYQNLAYLTTCLALSAIAAKLPSFTLRENAQTYGLLVRKALENAKKIHKVVI